MRNLDLGHLTQPFRKYPWNRASSNAYVGHRLLFGEQQSARVLVEVLKVHGAPKSMPLSFFDLEFRVVPPSFLEQAACVPNGLKNRLPPGLECKAVGPASSCFCGHRYREHTWSEYPETGKLKCHLMPYGGCSCETEQLPFTLKAMGPPIDSVGLSANRRFVVLFRCGGDVEG